MSSNQSIDTGWIMLHRKITDHWIWRDAEKLKWWLDIVLSVNHTNVKVPIGFELMECRRGQSLNSLQTWAKRWQVDVSTVRRFFRLLQNDKMILTENVRKTTRLTVCNYDAYNSKRHEKQSQNSSKLISEESQTNTNNNGNNEKNDKNANTVDNLNFSFMQFWDLYDKKVGSYERCCAKWEALTDEERTKIVEYVPRYVKSTPDKKYRKNPETFFNQKAWNNEIVNEVKTYVSNYKLSENNEW